MALKLRSSKRESRRDFRVSVTASTWTTSTWILSPKKFSKESIVVSEIY